jgi:hypothetical protein
VTTKQPSDSVLPPDPVGDALADVYLFLLRKAAERKRGMAAMPDTGNVADTAVARSEDATRDLLAPGAQPNITSAAARD